MSGAGAPLPTLGIRVPLCGPASATADTIAEAERRGFASAWVPDSQLLWRDPFASLAVAAGQTANILLGVAVTNVETRAPSVIASSARTVAELAPGRFVVAVGAGNSALAPLGRQSSSTSSLAAGIDEIRTLLAGEPVEYVAGVSQVLCDPPSQNVPVLAGASGPRNLEMAGACADGAVILAGSTPSLMGRCLDRIRRGATSTGRSLGNLRLVATAFCHVTTQPDRDARLLKPLLAAMWTNGASSALATHGIHVEHLPNIAHVKPDLMHAHDWTAAIEACDPWISDEDALRFAAHFCLFGSVDEIMHRVAQMRASGIDHVFVQHIGSWEYPDVLIDQLGAAIDPTNPSGRPKAENRLPR